MLLFLGSGYAEITIIPHPGETAEVVEFDLSGWLFTTVFAGQFANAATWLMQQTITWMQGQNLH